MDRTSNKYCHAFSALICASLAAFAWPSAASADQRVCSVSRLEGEANVIQAAGPGQPLLADATIPEGAEIETGASSRVEIQCSDATVMTIGPDTRVDTAGLLTLADQDSSVLVRLLRGIVGIVAPNRTWSEFQVETTLAVASVRSTEWLVEHSEASGTDVFVALGEVNVLAGGDTRVLAEGDGVSVQPSGTVGEVVVWGDERVAAGRGALGFSWASADTQ